MYVGPLALSRLHLVEVAWQGRAILPIRNGMLLDPGELLFTMRHDVVGKLCKEEELIIEFG